MNKSGFHLSVEIYSHLLRFSLTMLSDWLKKSRHFLIQSEVKLFSLNYAKRLAKKIPPLSHPVRGKSKTNHTKRVHISRALSFDQWFARYGLVICDCSEQSNQVAHQARAYLGFCRLKRLGVSLLPPDRMLFHRRVTPPPPLAFSSFSIYTPGWGE